jgi:type II secretory pathway pseudopilin PulG
MVARPQHESRNSAMRKRAAFTLVEMLVSMALILFVMVILSTAFTTGLQVFRQLKGLGDMEERLRSAAQILRRDLAAYHFENYRRLSDPNFWGDGPPQQGFFRIWQGSASTLEGQDVDGIKSSRATNHFLHFTCKLSGQGQGDFATSDVTTVLSSLIPPAPPLLALPPPLAQSAQDLLSRGDSRYQPVYTWIPGIPGAQGHFQGPLQFRGRWYEVVYFMQPSGLSTGGSGVPLNTLYRRQLGILDTAGVFPSVSSQVTGLPVPLSNVLASATGTDWMNFSEIACRKVQDFSAKPTLDPIPGIYQDNVHFSTPADLTMPARRFAMLPPNPNVAGATELAGIPANPMLQLNTLAGQQFPIAGRSYPYFGQVATLPSPWGQPLGLAPPYYGVPTTWQGNLNLQGADMLLTDVISFEVKPLVADAGDFVDLNDARLDSLRYNPTFFIPLPPRTIAITPKNPNPNGPAVFDTWSNQNDTTYDYTSSATTGSTVSIPLPVKIIALKITIRLWDAKTQQARQVSIIQEM